MGSHWDADLGLKAWEPKPARTSDWVRFAAREVASSGRGAQRQTVLRSGPRAGRQRLPALLCRRLRSRPRTLVFGQ